MSSQQQRLTWNELQMYCILSFDSLVEMIVTKKDPRKMEESLIASFAELTKLRKNQKADSFLNSTPLPGFKKVTLEIVQVFWSRVCPKKLYNFNCDLLFALPGVVGDWLLLHPVEFINIGDRQRFIDQLMGVSLARATHYHGLKACCKDLEGLISMKVETMTKDRQRLLKKVLAENTEEFKTHMKAFTQTFMDNSYTDLETRWNEFHSFLENSFLAIHFLPQQLTP